MGKENEKQKMKISDVKTVLAVDVWLRTKWSPQETPHVEQQVIQNDFYLFYLALKEAS